MPLENDDCVSVECHAHEVAQERNERVGFTGCERARRYDVVVRDDGDLLLGTLRLTSSSTSGVTELAGGNRRA